MIVDLAFTIITVSLPPSNRVTANRFKILHSACATIETPRHECHRKHISACLRKYTVVNQVPSNANQVWIRIKSTVALDVNKCRYVVYEWKGTSAKHYAEVSWYSHDLVNLLLFKWKIQLDGSLRKLSNDVGNRSMWCFHKIPVESPALGALLWWEHRTCHFRPPWVDAAPN